MNSSNLLEQSYLKHILIAVEVRDFSFPFRTAFDNWWAFKEGGPFLNGNSRPHWYNNPSPDKHGRALNRAHFISQAAARTLGSLARERLMKDHAIPVAVLRDLLFDEQPKSVDEIRAFMLRYYRFGIITQEEDDSLNAAGLRSKMPRQWNRGDSPFARYDAVGIVVQDHGARVSAPQIPPAPRKKPRNRIAGWLSSTASKSSWKGIRSG
jgi:hypothetical protein